MSRREVAGAVIAGVLGVACAWVIMELSPERFAVPWSYDGDALWCLASAKTAAEHGWFLSNPDLGYPHGYSLYGFPSPDHAHFAFQKVVGLLGVPSLDVPNAYLFLTFFLTGVVAFIALRMLGLHPIGALTAATIYSLLPCHFMRGIGHLHLAAYYMVPLATAAAVQAADCFFSSERHWARVPPFVLMIAASMPLFGVYYAFFFCVLVVAFGWLAAAVRRGRAPLMSAGLVLGVCAGSLGLCLMPTVVYRLRAGSSAAMVERLGGDAEFYNLRLVQMFLPIPGHRISVLADIAALYAKHAPLVNENVMVVLGFAGSACFLGFSLFAVPLFFRAARDHRETTLRYLAAIVAVSFVYATQGGIGSLVAYAVGGFIRGTNRMSVYLVFAALAGAMLLLQEGLRRRVSQVTRQIAAHSAVLGLALATLLWDLGASAMTPRHAHNAVRFQADREFFARLQQSVPEGHRILQLPYVPFPEGGMDRPEDDYAQFRPFLHTQGMKWSFGVMRGGDGARAIAALSARVVLEPQAVLPQVRETYDGILVNRLMAQTLAPHAEGLLAERCGQPLLANSEFAYFELDACR